MNSFALPLLRDAGRLLLLQNQPLPTVGKRLRCRGVDSAWRLEQIDIEQVAATTVHLSLQPVREAWVSLAHARHDAGTLAALLLVLCASSSSGARCATPAPELRGIDLRPWLSDAHAIHSCLAILQSHLHAALRLLSAHSALPFQALKDNLLDVDLFVLTRCGERIAWTDADASTRLGRELLALSPPDRRWIDSSIAADAANRLDLAQDDAMGIVARVWTQSGSAWLREVAQLRQADQWPVLRMLVEAGAAMKSPPRHLHRLLAALDHAGKPGRRTKDLRWLVKGLARGACASYLGSALRIAKVTDHDDVTNWTESPRCPWPVSSHFFITLRVRSLDYHARRAWLACSEVPGFYEVFQCIKSCFRLPTYELRSLVTTLVNLARYGQEKKALSKAEMQHLVRLVLDQTRRLHGDARDGWLNSLSSFINRSMCLNAKQIECAIGLALQLTKKLDSAVFNVLTVVNALVENMGGESLHEIAKMEIAWFKRIGELANTWVRRDRAINGISKLNVEAHRLLWPSGKLAPLTWFNVMMELNCLPRQRVTSLIACAAEHPLFACKLSLYQLDQAVVLIDSVRDERCKTNPVSSRLRQHLAGRRTLARQHLEHDFAALERGLAEAQLHLFDELVQAEIWRAFPGLKPESGITGHSLKLALTVKNNERPLRQLLRAWAIGDTDWLMQHAANRRWAEGLGNEAAMRWYEGFAATRVLPSFGEVTIAPEHDLQEVLRMGSAVGSCLSLGAFNSFSAAANALDANKRVLYARTADGKVVGRQLIAISEEKRLVCFSPYPVSLREELADFFVDYDAVLASHLGLPLHRAGDYTIKPLVAKEWYDDCPWDRLLRAA